MFWISHPYECVFLRPKRLTARDSHKLQLYVPWLKYVACTGIRLIANFAPEAPILWGPSL